LPAQVGTGELEVCREQARVEERPGRAQFPPHQCRAEDNSHGECDPVRAGERHQEDEQCGHGAAEADDAGRVDACRDLPGMTRRGGRLSAFYDWCAQNEAIPELVTLTTTISRWEEQIVTAVLTGVTNATSESLNRLAKLEARLAYGFRNPASQRRRVRVACTRGTRRQSPTATSRTKRSVISQQQVPG
jgi:transposase